MASSDSDDYYTEDDDETEYTSEDEDDDEGDEEDDDEDSEYSLEIDEDDDDEDTEDDDEDDDDGESIDDAAEEYENAEEEVSGSDSDDDEEGQVPALEHGQQDEISEGPDAPISGFSTPVDAVADDAQTAALPSPADQPTKDVLLLKGNPNSASTGVVTPASLQLDGSTNTTVSSLATDLENAKIESPPAA